MQKTSVETVHSNHPICQLCPRRQSQRLLAARSGRTTSRHAIGAGVYAFIPLCYAGRDIGRSALMHTHDLSAYTHDHIFDRGNPAAERGTRIVMWVTAAMMVIEITGGWWLNSMALMADGWHMSSHAIAIGLSAFAYSAARLYQN